MHDLRLAVRTLRATPIVTAVAILSLALGIGANTAIFSLVDSLVLRSLPIAEPDRLAMLSTGPGDENDQYSNLTVDEIRKYADRFDGVCAWALPGKGTFGLGADSRTIDRQFVSGEYFSLLGVRPILGRLIEGADDVPGGGPDGKVAVISYDFWQRQFGGSPQVLGSSAPFERMPATIIGVTPRGFSGVIVGQSFDVAYPVRTQPALMPATPYPDSAPWLRVMLRLKPGQSLEEGSAVMRAAQPAIRAASKPPSSRASVETFLREPFRLRHIGTGVSPLREQFELPLFVLLGVVGLVLLIACANVANLMLARGAARTHEMAVRLALGASRWRLARQLLAESAIISAAGGAVALLFAGWVSRAIVTRLSTFKAPIVLDLVTDWRVLGFTALTMIGTTLLFGIAPALRAGRVAPAAIVQAASRQPGGATGHLSPALIVVQIAMSLTLVALAGLLVQSFVRLAAAPLGFERNRAVVVTVRAPTVAAAERTAFFLRLVTMLHGVAGVSDVGGSMNPPIAGTLLGNFVVSDPGVAPPLNAEVFSQSDEVTPGFISAYGMRLLAGRDFDDRDTPTSPRVMIVNEAFVRRYVRGDPIGQALALTYRMAAQGDYPLGTRTIVGVVGDSVYRVVRDAGRPTIYFPLTEDEGPNLQSTFFVAVRGTAGSPMLLTRSISDALLAMNPDLALTFRPMGDQVDAALAQDRVVAWLAGFFGVLSMLLAALGLYGVTAYSVVRQRIEIGIRMALGAAPGGIMRHVLGRVALVVVAGLAAGVGAAIAAARFVESLLYGVHATDATTLAAAAFVLTAVSGTAAFLPARRASRVEPAEVLREG
jgi:putative ABC transport system permease protein